MPPLDALLLDFGGVIADGPDHPRWLEGMVSAVGEVLAAEGAPPMPGEAIRAALQADEHKPDEFWRDEAPRQTSYGAFWGDVIAADWPAPARAALAAQGELLSRRYMELKHAPMWQLRPGMRELLADAADRSVPVAVVSNTLHGAPQREFLDSAGLADRFAAQLYSDEEGVRKPNPEFALRAAAALGADPATCWFVGDTLTRDILVARRAQLGAAVLMRSGRVEHPPHPDGAVPDAVVADPDELRTLLAGAWGG